MRRVLEVLGLLAQDIRLLGLQLCLELAALVQERAEVRACLVVEGLAGDVGGGAGGGGFAAAGIAVWWGVVFGHCVCGWEGWGR